MFPFLCINPPRLLRIHPSEEGIFVLLDIEMFLLFRNLKKTSLSSLVWQNQKQVFSSTNFEILFFKNFN